MLDIFNSDAFGVVPLTDAINQLNYVPGRIGQMGLFRPSGISALSVAIEQKGGILKLIPPTPRGAPGTTLDKSKRSMLDVRVPHFEVNDAIMAEEVQGIRAFGSETLLETVAGKINDRNAEVTQSFAATEEFSRIGAIKGIVTYADGSTLNLFTTFGVSQIAAIDWDLDNATPEDGILRATCAGVYRTLAAELGGTPFSGIHAFCGDDFFDELIKHPEVRETYKNWAAAEELRSGYVDGNGQSFGAFSFGGITWENYRGQVDDELFVASDEVHMFPLGVPGLFRTYYAPADYMETVNTVGLRLYQKQWAMPNGKGVNLDTQTNALHLCTRPRVLIPGTLTG